MQSTSTNHDPYFLHIPFPKRWDCHKETILSLYMESRRTVEDVANTMKLEYKFDASIRQYKYHFKKWGVAKSVPSSVKRKAIDALERRFRDGLHVGGVRYNGMEVEKKRLRRYLQSESRLDQDWHLDGVIFTNWSLPYKVLKASTIHNIDISSPSNSDERTPSDVSVFSPQPESMPSPAGAPSPINAPTPTTMAIRTRTFDNRARYLLQGRNQEFLKDMPASEKSVATTWLYQFWLFAFSSAKYWGKGPLRWSFELLNAIEFPVTITLPNTPTAVGVASYHGAFDSPASDRHLNHYLAPAPPLLCRWAIHCSTPKYKRIPSPPAKFEPEFDGRNPDNWPEWPAEAYNNGLVNHLQEGLQNNTFSNIKPNSLPLSASQVAKAASRSPKELQVEAVGFAIMAQNPELLFDLLDNKYKLDYTKLHPFHLAVNYLNGAKTCCLILHELLGSLVRKNLIKNIYVNDLGYTVLDSLMLRILHSHTSCTPGNFDDRTRMSQRFIGEEVDICGRWDADSPCIRALNARGTARIPFEWKHMFCHTSVQAICHAISTIFSLSYSPNINTPSGLFTKHCPNCSQKLQLLPLHTLVLTAFYLAHCGCNGETLFGSLACMVCLLSHGANPLQKAEISVPALLGLDDTDFCSHTAIDPLELAQQVPMELQAEWSQEVRLGWDVIIEVLNFAQKERKKSVPRPSSGHQANNTDDDEFDLDIPEDLKQSIERDDYDNDDKIDPCKHEYQSVTSNIYGKSAGLGMLWASIQTELVTYRQLREGDPWLSENFSMLAVFDALKSNRGMEMLPHIERSMLKPFCRCGRFIKVKDPGCITSDEASAYFFANLDSWERSNFLEIPRSGWY